MDQSPPKVDAPRQTSSVVADDGPLFVDLDGTLIASDVTWESLLLAVRSDPSAAVKIPFWLLSGLPHLKQKVAAIAVPDVERLPYHSTVLDFLRGERARGRRLVLATASNQLVAGKVADYLGLFDDRISTSGNQNLKGRHKLAAIEAYCQRHGLDKFSYMGDARVDLPIWQASNHVYAVAPSRHVQTAIERLDKPVHLFAERQSPWRQLFRALRPGQWVKNLLVFVPLILAHRLTDAQAIAASVWALIAFSAAASCAYLVNDMLDLQADRAHPDKRRRPLACGELSLSQAVQAVPVLILIALGISWAFLPPLFLAMLVCYLAASLCYSVWLKRKPIIDVLLLANLYTLRVLAGGVAADVPISEWLVAFATFFFLSLAFVKRYSELIRLAEPQAEAKGRGYAVSDLSLIESMGPCSGYLSVLVLALYINSEPVKNLYPQGKLLWLLCALLLYWISRLWFWAKRGEVLEDPVVFTITDRNSLIVAAVGVAVMAAAAWSG